MQLEDGATVAVIGGGPAGAFFSIFLLRKSQQLGRSIRVVIFERRRAATTGHWKGCNYCAGGISPRLNDRLREIGLKLPPGVVQSRIHSVVIQGFWKNIELEVPPGREMLSVYRGSLPSKRVDGAYSLDSFLLDQAIEAGADLIGGQVLDVRLDPAGRPLVLYQADATQRSLESDLVVFATGVNETTGLAAGNSLAAATRRLMPGFVPPRLRRSLIFELECKPSVASSLASTVHFVEYGSKALPLEMCSLVPKRGFVTAVLVGPSVDSAQSGESHRRIIQGFLALPHIKKLLWPGVQGVPGCSCNPNLVVGSAKNPFGDRATAVGDLVTSRLYKDGILTACQTAGALANTVLENGVDAASLRRGYGPVLNRWRRDNRFARIVFLLHRLFFSSSVLSRVLYQAVITERKTTRAPKRRLEQLLWRIASGDDRYESIFLSMIHPATIWRVLMGGMLITLRNYLTELAFGLHWDGFGRYTTGVPLECLEAKRREFARLTTEAHVPVPNRPEFERMYTIRICASRDRVLEQLGRFGETGRGYLRPRWVQIRRTAGAPLVPGCIIEYQVMGRLLSFSLVLEELVGGHLLVYRVRDGFAAGGVLVFECEQRDAALSALSIYVAFDFARGRRWLTRPYWLLFRLLFPAFVHDVLWNHSLCQLRDLVEAG